MHGLHLRDSAELKQMAKEDARGLVASVVGHVQGVTSTLVAPLSRSIDSFAAWKASRGLTTPGSVDMLGQAAKGV